MLDLSGGYAGKRMQPPAVQARLPHVVCADVATSVDDLPGVSRDALVGVGTAAVATLICGRVELQRTRLKSTCTTINTMVRPNASCRDSAV